MYTYSGNALGSRMAFDAVQSDLESSAYRSAAEWLTCAQACTMRSFQLLWIGIGSIMSDKQGLSSIRGGHTVQVVTCNAGMNVACSPQKSDVA